MNVLAPAQIATVVVGMSLLVVWLQRRGQSWPMAALLGVGFGGLAFQVGHTLEHALQVGVWSVHPSQPGYLTPWAAAIRDGLIVGEVATGNELLHLIGNLTFLVGLLAVVELVRRGEVDVGRPRMLRIALIVQAAHVVEHVALTVSTLAFGRAVGVTTLFGVLPLGTPNTSARVLAHFAINAVATGAVLAALSSSASLRHPASHDRPNLSQPHN